MSVPTLAASGLDLPAPEVGEDTELGRQLSGRLPAGSWQRSFSVTDLIDPRRAFWRHLHGPVGLTAERRARLDAGRDLHRRIDVALPAEGQYEVRVRRDGVSARIDLLADVPVEIKTGDTPLPERLVEDRPEYFEQIGIYCAVLDRAEARLVHLLRPTSGPPRVRAVDVAFSDVAGLRAEAGRRTTALRSALGATDPTGLPACRWYGRGCEFQAAGACSCRGAEPEPSSAIVDGVVGLVERGDVQTRWEGALAERWADGPPPTVRRFRDLVYPRRAYFETVSPNAEPGRTPVAEHRPSEVYDGAVGALEGGPVGDVHRLGSVPEAPEEEIAGWREEPYIVRTSRAWNRVRAEEAIRRFPQYALELGFRCHASGTRTARVVLAYERAVAPADRLQVLTYSFGSGVDRYGELFRARLAQLGRALAERRPAGLAACAGWMTAECPYRGSCGCAEELARSQR